MVVGMVIEFFLFFPLLGVEATKERTKPTNNNVTSLFRYVAILFLARPGGMRGAIK